MPSTPMSSNTLVLYLLDSTGSMKSIQDATVKQFNEMLDGLKGAHCFLRLVKFNSEEIKTITEGVPTENYKLVDYNPVANTPLYDAIGQAIEQTDNWLRIEAFSGRSFKVICVIHTDGQENASQNWTLRSIRQLIEQKMSTGYWQFIYAGVGQESWIDAVGTLGVTSQAHVAHSVAGAAMAATYTSQTVREYATTGKIEPSPSQAQSFLADTSQTPTWMQKPPDQR